MKKVIALMLSVVLMLSVASLPVFAAEGGKEHISENTSLGEIQEMFVTHLHNQGISLEPGSVDYYEYIVEQLLDHTDQNLRNNENYDLIHAYMAEYKVNYEDYLLCQELLNDVCNAEQTIYNIVESSDCLSIIDGDNAVEFSISDSFLGKTIADIIKENSERYDANHQSTRTTKLSGYSASDAAEYAVKWGEDKNSVYPNYGLSGGDCTNFVSQCIYAGGLSMKGSSASAGTVESTSDWYCIYIKSTLGIRKYAVTTSWIRVSDFNTFLSSLVSKSTETTLSSLISACSAGDVVQLADKTTGTPYHSIIINAKDTSTAYFCGHTSNRSNANVKEYLDDSADNFILFDFT